MKSKIEPKTSFTVTNRILNAVDSIPNSVSNSLKKSFYHKGRKSEEIAKKIIEAVTNPEDIVLDPFVGGGSFLVASVQAKRFFIGIELDNYTYDVLRIILSKCDMKKLDKFFCIVESTTKDKVNELYLTQCCSKKNVIKKLLFDPEAQEYFNPEKNREIVNGHNIKLMNPCTVCGSRTKQFDEYDLCILKLANTLDTSLFPKDKYIENSRINITASTGANRYDKIFTKRNQYALLLIQEAISKLPQSLERDILEHALVTTLALGRIAMYGSSTDILYHVVHSKAQEMNIWHLFKTNFENFKKFKKENADLQVSDIRNNGQYKLLYGDYASVLDTMRKFKADLIYTDFPYTDQVPYLERNQLFRIWLKTFYDNDKFQLTEKMLDAEIVQTNAPSREKKNSLDSYYKDLDTMFSILSQHIKDNRLVIFTIKLGKAKYIKTYSQIINLARKNGFEFVSRIGLTNTDPTLRKQSAYANTFMNEIILILTKLSSEQAYWYIENDNYEFLATKLIYNHLTRKRNKKPTTVTRAAQLIINDLKSRGYMYSPEDENRILKLLKDNFYLNEGYIFIDNNKLYLDIEDDTSLFIKLYDLIPIYIRSLLEKNGKFVLEDLYLELTSDLCNGDPGRLTQILDSTSYKKDIKNLINNYCEISNGFWVEKTREFSISNDSSDISQFTGTEFEELMQDVLEMEGYYNVVVKGGKGDRGVDIIASKLVNNRLEKTFFQCKRWISNVGSLPIQRLYAEKDLHKVDHAVCVTTSGYTPDGKQAAEDYGVVHWDGKDVLNLLNKHYPGKYYNRALNCIPLTKTGIPD